MATLARRLEDLTTEDALALPTNIIQNITGALVKLYAARAQAGDRFSPYNDQAISATEVLILASALMREANVALFELGMWQAWAGPNS